MMKTTKKLMCVLLAFVLAFGVCACTSESQTVSAPQETTSRYNTVADGHLRDKTALYKMDDPTEVVTMYLTVSTGNSAENTNHTWDEVNTYSVFDYDRMGVDRYKVAGLLQVGDENGPVAGEVGYGQLSPNCTVQIRGQTSSKSPQKNYKIKLKDNKGTWRGQQTIALNKHQTEGMRFRNKLGFDLISGIDQIMGLRTTFVHLYVKDTTPGGDGTFHDYGIYTQVEQLNKTALKAHGLDTNAHLYKINVCEFYRYEDVIKLTTDPTYDQKAFEEILETKGSDDHQKLIDLLEKVNDYSIPIEEILEDHFDLENITYWMAFNILVGNVDTQSRNFYIYSPLNSERWYILPWDLDGSLKKTEYAVKNRTDYTSWETGISNYWGNVLFQRCLKSEVFIEALDVAVEDLKSYLSPERISGYVEKYTAILKPYLFSGRDALHMPLTTSQYDYVASEIPKEIELNYNLYKESFERPMPFYIGVPRKTETGITFLWDGSYDFDFENISYTFELARDYNFNEIVVKHEGLMIPSVDHAQLPAGQYFMRVTATNESGYSQHAFDCYAIDAGKVYGTKCFYVDGDGKIVEDVYVEA